MGECSSWMGVPVGENRHVKVLTQDHHRTRSGFQLHAACSALPARLLNWPGKHRPNTDGATATLERNLTGVSSSLHCFLACQASPGLSQTSQCACMWGPLCSVAACQQGVLTPFDRLDGFERKQQGVPPQLDPQQRQGEASTSGELTKQGSMHIWLLVG